MNKETEMAEASESLPRGWSRLWSQNHSKHYFFNAKTRETTFSHPARYMNLTEKERIIECFKSWGKYHMMIPDTNVFLNNWKFIEFLMEIPQQHASIYVLQVVMKELDQREKGNVPGITASDREKAQSVNRKLAKHVKLKNFTGEKTHENHRSVVPAPDDTNDDRILKAVLKKPNALFFTNDNNLFTKAALQDVTVSRPNPKDMLDELLANVKKVDSKEFVHNRVEVTNQQREIEKSKRLANMKNIEWRKSKMKRNSIPCSDQLMSEGIFKNETFDHNDNCKLKDQMMINPSLLMPLDRLEKESSSSGMSMTPSPTDEYPGLADVFEMNPLFRMSSPQMVTPLVVTREKEVNRFNDKEKEKVISITPEDITFLLDPVAFGLFKIFEKEFIRVYGANALQRGNGLLTDEQINRICTKNLVGIIQLFFDTWSEIFRPIRNSRIFKNQLEVIQKVHETGQDKLDTNWLFCARNIFAFFRDRYFYQDLEYEYNLVENVLNGRPIAVENEQRVPLFPPNGQPTSTYPQNEDLVVQVANEPVTLGDPTSQRFIPTSPYEPRGTKTNHLSTSSGLPSYCVNPMDAVESTPEKSTWQNDQPRSTMVHGFDLKKRDSPSPPICLKNPEREIIIADNLGPASKSRVHRMTASYRTNPLDNVDDEENIFSKEAPTTTIRPTTADPQPYVAVDCASPIAQTKYTTNPMDLLDFDSNQLDCLNRNNSNSKSKTRKSSRPSKNEAINPDMLARITSEN